MEDPVSVPDSQSQSKAHELVLWDIYHLGSVREKGKHFMDYLNNRVFNEFVKVNTIVVLSLW